MKWKNSCRAFLGLNTVYWEGVAQAKPLALLKPPPALDNTIKHQEPSPSAQHPCHIFPPLPAIWRVSGQKHTEAVSNIHLPPPPSKNTVTQPEHGQTNLSVERDPFKRVWQGYKKPNSLVALLFPIHSIIPQPHHSPDSYARMEKEGLCLSLSLSCLSVLQNGVTRWEVMRVGLRKTVGMLKSKGQGCRAGGKEELCSRWTLGRLLLPLHEQRPQQANTGETETDSKELCCCGYLGERKAGSCPSRKGQEKEQKRTVFWMWHGRRNLCSLPTTLTLTLHPILC